MDNRPARRPCRPPSGGSSRDRRGSRGRSAEETGRTRCSLWGRTRTVATASRTLTSLPLYSVLNMILMFFGDGSAQIEANAVQHERVRAVVVLRVRVHETRLQPATDGDRWQRLRTCRCAHRHHEHRRNTHFSPQPNLRHRSSVDTGTWSQVALLHVARIRHDSEIP